MRKKKKQLLKIVYFDEGAATDFIYIFEGGKTEERKDNIIAHTSDIEARTEAKVSGSTKLFNFFRADASGEAGAGFNRELTI